LVFKDHVIVMFFLPAELAKEAGNKVLSH